MRVSITDLATFYTTSNSPIPQVSVFTFGIRTNMIHPINIGIDPFYHINCSKYTSFSQQVGLGGYIESFARYASLSHACRCFASRWVWLTALFLHSRLAAASISNSEGALSAISNGVTWVATGWPGRRGLFPMVEGWVVPWHLLQIITGGGGFRTVMCQYHRFITEYAPCRSGVIPWGDSMHAPISSAAASAL